MSKWVAGWGGSISVIAQSQAEYFKDLTVRNIFFPTMNGTKVRLHFSNQYGDEDALIDKVILSVSLGADRVDVTKNTIVTFDGKTALSLPAGAGDVVSDPIDFEISAGQEFSVSMYFAGMTKMMTGFSMSGGPYIKKYFGSGDYAAAESFPLEVYGENGSYLFLHTIDFYTEDDCHAIVAFGDSITALHWPDCLAHRIFDMGIRNTSIIRKAIPGGRVLRDYTYRIKKHWGEAGITRFERDISHAGVDRVYILHGINDIIHPHVNNRFCPYEYLPTSEELINNGFRKYIEIAHKHRLKVYIATILPTPRTLVDDGIREKIRSEINEWIRTTDEIDGVLDFDLAIRDPEDPNDLLPEYDCGDHVHPNFQGALCLAESIPEEYFQNDVK